MRRTLIAGISLALLSAFTVSGVAFADEEPQEDDSSIYFESEQEDEGPTHIDRPREPEENEDRHSEIEERHEDYKSVIIPPIAIRPQHRANPNVYELPVDGYSVDLSKELTPLPNIVLNPQGQFLITQLSDDGSIKLVAPEAGKLLLNPTKHEPIQINKLVLTRQTPADEFMQQAAIFGGALGAVALGLLTLTASTGIQARRRAKAKFFE